MDFRFCLWLRGIPVNHLAFLYSRDGHVGWAPIILPLSPKHVMVLPGVAQQPWRLPCLSGTSLPQGLRAVVSRQSFCIPQPASVIEPPWYALNHGGCGGFFTEQSRRFCLGRCLHLVMGKFRGGRVDPKYDALQELIPREWNKGDPGTPTSV